MSGGKILFSPVPIHPSNPIPIPLISVFDVLFNGGYWGQENVSEMEAGNILDEWKVGRARKNTRRQPRSCKEQVLMIVLIFFTFLLIFVCLFSPSGNTQKSLNSEDIFDISGMWKACWRWPLLKGELYFALVIISILSFSLSKTNFHHQMKISSNILYCIIRSKRSLTTQMELLMEIYLFAIFLPNQPSKWPTNQPTKWQINQPTKWQINQPTKRQTTNQPNDQTTNQPSNQRTQEPTNNG